MTELDKELASVGRITGPHGIKGWVKVHAQTEPAENIFAYTPWLIKTQQGLSEIEVLNWRAQGKGYIAQLKQVEDRNAAEAFCPVEILIEKSQFPALDAGDYYWYQLEACQVATEYEDQTLVLGEVISLMPTGANDVLVVAPTKDSIDDRERLIPYIPDQFVKSVDIDKQQIVVEWDPEF